MTSTKTTKRGLVKQLARYRASSGETMQKIADEMATTPSVIHNWISGEHLPTENNVDQLKIFLAGKNMTAPTARISDETALKLVAELRDIKQRDGLTFPDLAEKTGIAEQAIANWFQGMTKPTALNAYYIRNFLKGLPPKSNIFEASFNMQASQADMAMTAEDGTPYISSKSVAEWTDKRHDHLIRDVEQYISYLTDEEQNPNLGNGLTMRVEGYFLEDSYQTEEGGRSYKFYWCSRKGCELIANKMTGKKGVRFTAQYIEHFHAMEQAIKEEAPTPTPEKPAIKAPDTLAEAERYYIDALAKAITEAQDIAEKSRLTDKLTRFMQEVG